MTNKIKLIKDQSSFKYQRAITHAGIFHADDVFSVALLQMLNPEIAVERVFKVSSEISDDTLAFDIGGGKYDHHQIGAEERPWGVKYAAFGLLWRSLKLGEFGQPALPKDVYELVEREFVEPIDAYDNGQLNAAYTMPYLALSKTISWMNPSWDSSDDANTAFNNAVAFASQILEIAISSEISKVKAKGIVEDALAKSNGGYMVLDQFAPWQDWLFQSEKSDGILYAIYPSNRGGWNIQAVPTNLGSHELRKPFPESWRGLSQDDLKTKVGMGLTFVHPNGFLASADTLENAIRVAESAIEA